MRDYIIKTAKGFDFVVVMLLTTALAFFFSFLLVGGFVVCVVSVHWITM